MTIDTINLVIHPLFHEQEAIHKSPKDKYGSKVRGVTFGNIGRMVLNTGPNALFVFVPTHFISGSILDKEQKRFIEWGKKQLGSKFINSETEFAHQSQKQAANSLGYVQLNLFKYDFSQLVKLNVTGEIKGQCLKTGSNRIVEILSRKGVKKTSVKVMKNAKTSRQAMSISIDIMRKRLTFFSKWRREVQPAKRKKH